MKNIPAQITLLLLLHIFIFPAFVLGAAKNDRANTDKIRTQLLKLGIGEQAKIEVQLKAGGRIKGYLQEVRVDDFTVVDEATNKSVTVSYPQVQKTKGHNLNAGTKILIVVGILVLVGVLIGIEAGKS